MGRRLEGWRALDWRQRLRLIPAPPGAPCATPTTATMQAAPPAAPLVLRTKVAIGTGYGSQHSMDPAGIFATAPGWRIVAASTPFDYVGLMNAALACKGMAPYGVVAMDEIDRIAEKLKPRQGEPQA